MPVRADGYRVGIYGENIMERVLWSLVRETSVTNVFLTFVEWLCGLSRHQWPHQIKATLTSCSLSCPGKNLKTCSACWRNWKPLAKKSIKREDTQECSMARINLMWSRIFSFKAVCHNNEPKGDSLVLKFFWVLAQCVHVHVSGGSCSCSTNVLSERTRTRW